MPLNDQECDLVYCISVSEQIPEFENFVMEDCGFSGTGVSCSLR